MATATATKKVTVWDQKRKWEKDPIRKAQVAACGDDRHALYALVNEWTEELRALYKSGSHDAAAASAVCALAGYVNTPLGWERPDGSRIHPTMGDITYGGDEYEEDPEDEYDYEAELRYLNPWVAMEDDLDEYDY